MWCSIHVDKNNLVLEDPAKMVMISEGIGVQIQRNWRIPHSMRPSVEWVTAELMYPKENDGYVIVYVRDLDYSAGDIQLISDAIRPVLIKYQMALSVFIIASK